MVIILEENNQYVLRFEKGDSFFLLLEEFAKQENISSASFTAIGAAEHVTLACYDLPTKSYIDKELAEDLEIASLIGNITTFNENIAIHTHGTFSDKTFTTYAGHVKQLIVSATCEVMLTKYHKKIVRKHDTVIGLNLMDRSGR